MRDPGKTLTWPVVCEAFAIFLLVWVFFVPFLFYTFHVTDETTASNLFLRTTLHLTGVGISLIAFILFLFYLGGSQRSEVLGEKRLLPAYFKGFLTIFLAYPVVWLAALVVETLLAFFHPSPHLEQTAVQNLKDLMLQPALFFSMAAAVAFFIPFMEELLFRGFLQTRLKAAVGTWKAVALTSLLFAFFHFSVEQGIDNIQIITSLFMFSCCLGIVRERFHSLWASVGLHSAFNLLNIVVLYTVRG